MNTDLKVEKDLLLELQEAEKVNMATADGGTYSVTVAYGGLFSIICC
jgi:hypothetical protein